MPALNTIVTLPKRAILTDTGPIYASLNPRDEFHVRAKAEGLKLEREGLTILVSAPILLEAHILILYRLGTIRAATWLARAYPAASLLNPSPSDCAQARLRVRRYADQSITLTDAVLAELSDQFLFPVWTFDHHFDIMGVSVWR